MPRPLLCADGLASTAVARKLRVRDQTVSKWRGRFVRDRLDGLYDEPRPGAPRTITDDAVERVVTRTLETTPRGQTHWSVRGMAQTTGLSRMTIARIWHAFGLPPHRSETFKLSPDPLLIEKARDIVGLYMNPPEHAVVLCVGGPMFFGERARIVDLAAKSRLPLMATHREYPEAGGLLSYGIVQRDNFRRAAAYVDKILKGAKPADLPVEQPTKFELVINLKTAKALGLTIPPILLQHADQLIE